MERDILVALLGALLVFTAVISLFWDRSPDEEQTADVNTTSN